MANRFSGTGNLAYAPELQSVSVDGQTRRVANMRIYFDRPVHDGDGGFEDRGGFWLSVSLWGARAEHAARTLPKGARVDISGTLLQELWEKDGETVSRIELKADRVTLDLARVASITFRAKAPAAERDGAQQMPDTA